MALQLMITQDGFDALVDMQNGETTSIRIVEVGLTANAFTMAPTIHSLPGEIKRLDAVSGEAVSETIIHMTALDASSDSYDLRGLGLYLDDGTLFAVYSQPTPIFRKVAATSFLLAQDIAFANGEPSGIVFGDTMFLYPPATEDVAGVAEVATSAEVTTGTDDMRLVTPLKLKQRLDALAAALADAIATAVNGLDSEVTAAIGALDDELTGALAALLARTITGDGLVSGGGDLTANRVLTVLAASAADVAAGSAADRAVTPAALAGLARSLLQNGYALLPGCGGLILQWGRFTAISNGVSSKLFPLTFPGECFAVVPAGGTNGGADSKDNPPVLLESTVTASGFSVFSADDTSAGVTFIAVGI
ncbi:MAG: hypothetical protein WBL20_14635 [Sphingobium sp.]|uniref:gp53-like domain-containing protein n=1 Tax=Sphingobium sp. TaxID=1912891 RepID=UPI003BB1BD71